MRRQHTRTIREEERPTLLLMAAGAVAGAAAGLYLGRRYRSMDAFLTDARKRLGDLRELWRAVDVDADDRVRLRSEVVDDLEDEDEDYDELDEDELDEDEPNEGSFAGAFDDVDEDEDEDLDAEDEDEDEYEFDDELEDDLAATVRDNGAPDITQRRREESARRLEERVLRELSDEPALAARAIEIAVVGDGVVELTGTVHTIEEVSRAAAIARSVAGVSMVLNRIDVRAGGHIDTASVAREPSTDPDAPTARD